MRLIVTGLRLGLPASFVAQRTTRRGVGWMILPQRLVPHAPFDRLQRHLTTRETVNDESLDDPHSRRFVAVERVSRDAVGVF